MDWNVIKTEYITTDTSYRKLAGKYGVSFSTLRKIAAKEHWTELRNNVGMQRDTELVKRLGEVLGENTAKIDDKYFRLVDKLLDKAEEVIDQTPIWQVSSLKEMATAMKYIKECKGIKSDADMREQEARIANLRKQTGADDTVNEVTVTIEGGEGSWQS